MASKGTAIIYPSAARTATPTAVTSSDIGSFADQITDVTLIIDVSALALTPSVVPTIEAQDPISELWVPLLTATAVTATGTTYLSFGMNTPVAAGVSGQGVLPKTWRIVMTHADTDSITYSVSMNYRTE